MHNQVKTIDVDQIWMDGEQDPCQSYVKYSKIRSKYVVPIIESMNDLSKKMSGSKEFKMTPYKCKLKIRYLLNSVERLELKHLNYLLESNCTLTSFIRKINGIRDERNRINAKRRGYKSKVRQEDNTH